MAGIRDVSGWGRWSNDTLVSRANQGWSGSAKKKGGGHWIGNSKTNLEEKNKEGGGARKGGGSELSR